MSGLSDGLFQYFLNWLYSTSEISIPSDFHTRCMRIQEMLDNDISGIINSVLDYSISSASNTHYKIECSDTSLEKLFNIWLQKINLELVGIPTGLQELSKEYYKERWSGSSLCLLRLRGWEKITIDNNVIEVPTILWYPNGASIYTKRPKGNYKLGSDEFYLDEALKVKLPEKASENIIVQKPFDRWFVQYPTPYLIRKGIYKNWLAMKTLQDKSDEVISKILPYLFIIKKGTELLSREGFNYEDKDLQAVVQGLKTELEKYKSEKGKTPTTAQPYDTEFSHLIPDLRNIVSEELYRQGIRSILSGLGIAELIPVTGQSRQQSLLNPKLLIEEINNGVEGFKAMLLDVVNLIILRNKEKHPKLFSGNNKIIIVNSPLKINTELILDALRSGYDRGASSIQTYQEILGLDNNTERERRKKELDNGDEDLFYPHLIQNREDIPDRLIPAKPKNEKNEDKNKKPGTPEANNFKNAEEEKLDAQEGLISAPYTEENYPDYLNKYPGGAKNAWIITWNLVYKKTKDESKAFPIAWNSLKRWLKKHDYIQKNGNWIKKSEAELLAEEVKLKQNKLLDKLLHEEK